MIAFRQRVPPANHATGMAHRAHESQNPRLWFGHKATIYPSWAWSPSIIAPTMGLGSQEASIVGLLTRGVGHHGIFLDDHGSGGNYVRFPAVSGASNHMKMTAPPFTLHMLVRRPTQAAGSNAFVYTSDEKTALGNYNGVMVWLDASTIWVATADNTTTVFNALGTAWTSASATLSAADLWAHVIVVVRAVGSDVTGWFNDSALSFGYNAGQTQVTVAARHTNCGWQRSDGTFTVGYADLALWQLWNRALSEGEITTLRRDPLAMLRPVRRMRGKASASASRVVSLGGHVLHSNRVVLAG